MDAPLVSVVILNWNGLPHVISCLEKVLASCYPSLSVIVVDNGSTDGSVEVIIGRFPDVVLLKSATNLGYAAGNNIGLREALASKADYILVLNNDTEIAPDMIACLVAALDRNREAGIAGAKIYLLDAPEKLWAVGGVFGSRQVETWGINEPDLGQYDGVELDFVFGCGMLLRREVLERIGLFDPRFRFYYEDIDLCIRAKQVGFAAIWVPQAVMWHQNAIETQSSSRFKVYHYERSRMLFFMKHLQGLDKARFVLSEIQYVLVSFFRYLRRGDGTLALWHIIGAVDGAFSKTRKL